MEFGWRARGAVRRHHGWYFQNQSDKKVTVHLKLSGFYEMIPPGEYGNEGKIDRRFKRRADGVSVRFKSNSTMSRT